MRLFWMSLCAVLTLNAQISNVQVTGSTNVQSIVTWQSPSDAACTLEVSQDPSYRPLVPDVDPDLFPGADLDSRDGNISDGRSRVFVVGKRAVHQAADIKWYSRALQTETLHYFRIRCGSATATGTFRTANVALGVTSPWPIPQDADGNFRWPSTDNNNRSQAVVDPNYGTLIRRISIPGDSPQLEFKGRKFGQASGAAWTNPAGALTDDAASADFSSAGNDWLALTQPGLAELGDAYVFGSAIDLVTVTVKGSSSGPTDADRTIEACLTIDGASCYTGMRRAVLPAGQGTVTLGSGRIIETWDRTLWANDVGGNKSFGVLIRAAKPGTAVSIQYASIDMTLSEMPGMADSGNLRTCAPLKSNGGFHCSYPGANNSGPNHIFWIQPDTGEARFLGTVVADGWGGSRAYCLSTNALWDFSDPNIYYCVGSVNNKQVLLKGTYTGGDAAAEPGAVVAMKWENLTPGANTIDQLIAAFNPSFDRTQFNCALSNLVGDYAVFSCRRSGQDSYGWIAVLDLGNRQPIGQGGTGRVVAAAQSYASPSSRWCGLHSIEPLIGVNWIGWTPKNLTGNQLGFGPYTVTLQSSLPAAAGNMTIRVSGEPEPALMDAAVGDVFWATGSQGTDLLKITAKNGTSWTVTRKVVGAAPAAVSSGAKLTAFCNAYFDDPAVAPTVYWSFLDDPAGADSTGRRVVVEKVLTGSHIVQRGNYRLQELWSDGFEIITPGAPNSWNKAVTYRIPSNPKYNGVRAQLGLDDYPGIEAYQTHPSYENFLASGPGRNNWFTDLMPFIGFPRLTGSVTPVAGSSQVYKANGVQLHRQAFPTFAKCGGRMLKEIAGPIRDSDNYTFCIGSACAPGAGASDVYVSCPAPVSSRSSCTQAFFGDDSSVCVSDLPAFGQSVSQFYFDPSGTRTRVLTNAMMAVHAIRTALILTTASPLPDGSWIVFSSYGNNARRDLYMVKVPSQPPFDPDPSAGSKPVDVPVSVAAPSGLNVAQVVLQYGASPALGSSTGKQDCASGATCTVTAPGRWNDVMYYKAVYLDSSGQVVGTGKLQVRVTAASKPGKPAPRGIKNAARASADSWIAPGGYITLAGDGLAACEAAADALPLPSSLCGSSVTVNGSKAPLSYAAPQQVNALLPQSITPGRDAQVVVSVEGESSDPLTVPGDSVLEAAPAIFSYTLADQTDRAVIQNPDLTICGPQGPAGFRPLRLGETGTMYANSLGPVSSPVSDGAPSPTDPLARVLRVVEVWVNGVRQSVLFAGLTPQIAGLYQINFTLDPLTPILDNDANRVWLRIGDVESAHLAISLAPVS